MLRSAAPREPRFLRGPRSPTASTYPSTPKRARTRSAAPSPGAKTGAGWGLTTRTRPGSIRSAWATSPRAVSDSASTTRAERAERGTSPRSTARARAPSHSGLVMKVASCTASSSGHGFHTGAT